MINWDEIHKAHRQYIDSGKDDLSLREWESSVKDQISRIDSLINNFGRNDVHQLRSVWLLAKKLTTYARQSGLDCASVFELELLPSEPIPDNLKGRVLSIDTQGNWLMNDSVLSISYASIREQRSV